MTVKFTQRKLDSLHDVLLNAIGEEDLSNEEIITYWNMLPETIKADALHYGVSDTPTKEDMFTWFKEHCKQK